MNQNRWLAGWLTIVIIGLASAGYWVYKVDPFFHYHEPDLTNYYYELYNQRSQNDGIIKHFDYDALLTGTSMGSGFKTSEADVVFDRHFIKVTFSGALYKELNDNIETALKVNPQLKTVVRSLDLNYCNRAIDDERSDMGDYPSYLYDANPFNDVHYILNRDILFERVYTMIDRHNKGESPGITPFDEYARYADEFPAGINSVKPEGISVTEPARFTHLSDRDKDVIRKNIEQNVTRTADEHPDVDFYYYYPPYSIAFWADSHNNGSMYYWLEAERYVTELIVPHHNIHLYSFFSRQDIITDLNNYKDTMHYAPWICSLMLKWMKAGEYQLTEDTYQDLLDKEYTLITQFDYSSINTQDDYEADGYAAALLNHELLGTDPLDLTSSIQSDNMCHANFDDHDYLCFRGRKLSKTGSVMVRASREDGTLVAWQEFPYDGPDSEDHLYVFDLSNETGDMTISIENSDSDYIIESMILY